MNSDILYSTSTGRTRKYQRGSNQSLLILASLDGQWMDSVLLSQFLWQQVSCVAKTISHTFHKNNLFGECVSCLGFSVCVFVCLFFPNGWKAPFNWNWISHKVSVVLCVFLCSLISSIQMPVQGNRRPIFNYPCLACVRNSQRVPPAQRCQKNLIVL